jgi:hypothetical protein
MSVAELKLRDLLPAFIKPYAMDRPRFFENCRGHAGRFQEFEGTRIDDLGA